jgi:hypothetical protein
MKIGAVNGRKYDGDVLREEIRAAKGTAAAITLFAEQASFSGVFRIEYHDGERFPHLEGIAGAPDVLGEILKPRAAD